MSDCGCNVTPCACNSTGDSVTDAATHAQDPSHFQTLCDGDRVNNVWVEGARPDGSLGICMLDTMEEHQIINVLQRDPKARTDLLRVTTNPYLRDMVERIPMMPGHNEGDKLQKEANQDTMVLYTVFRGVPPWNG
jgi:hypothetical protein